MKRAVIIVKGEVQRVGYRDAVKKIARKLKIGMKKSLSSNPSPSPRTAGDNTNEHRLVKTLS